jgi:hypothetical protein
LDDAADARYVPTGHLLFLRRGTLMAVGFDLRRLEVTSQPVPMIENVMQAVYSVAPAGNSLYALQRLSRAISTTLEENQLFKMIDATSLAELGFEKTSAFILDEKDRIKGLKLMEMQRRIVFIERGTEFLKLKRDHLAKELT